MIKNISDQIICNEFGFKIYQKLMKSYPELLIEKLHVPNEINNNPFCFANNNNINMNLLYQNQNGFNQFLSKMNNNIQQRNINF